jgi:hypothetical protein
MPKSPAKGGSMPKQEINKATWVQEMHKHFNATGTYSTSDIHRVLGDQAKHVDVEICTEPCQAAKFNRR